MPKIFKSNNFILSDEVFTISEDEWVDEAGENAEDEEGKEPKKREPTEEELKIAQAEKMAEEILEQARQDAEIIRKEAAARTEFEHQKLMEEAAQECEVLRQRAYQESSAAGFQQGLRDGVLKQADAISQCIGNLEFGVSKLEGQQAGFMAEYEKNLKWLALEIASKILSKRIEEDDAQLLSLVKTAVASVKNAQWITIEISERMTGLIDLLTQELRRANEDKVSVRPVDGPEGLCRVDTPEGIIDASVTTQLENLRLYFLEEDNMKK